MTASGRAGPLLHVDADAFFASVVLRSHPELADQPMAVTVHGFVASANYVARTRGVRSGRRAVEAAETCPGLRLFEVPRQEVDEVADALFDLFHQHAEAVEPGSIEEAFLDPADTWPGAVDTARRLRARVQAELGITVSVGVGSTKLMAKLASRAAKPDGLHVISGAEEVRLRDELPVADVWGVGATTVERLERLGVRRLADVDRVPRPTLRETCGTTMARLLWSIRDGSDDAVVRPVRDRTFLSAEGAIVGYARPDWSTTELVDSCLERVCRRVERAGLAATGVTLTLHPEDGGRSIVLRRTGLPATADLHQWLPVTRDLLDGAEQPLLARVRVTLTGLTPVDQADLTLF